MRPGQVERRTHEPASGTTSLFAALDTRTGKVIGRCHQRHRAVEFRKFLDTIEAEVPADLDVDRGQLRHPQDGADPELVCQAAPLPYALHTHQRLVAEPGGALVRSAHRKAVAPRRHQSRAELETAIYRYLDITNEDPKPFVWTKTADQILANVAHFCQRTLNTGH